MEEAGDLLEDSWFFGNLLNTKTRTFSRSYSDPASSSCPPLGSTQEHVLKNERKSSSFSSRKQRPVANPSPPSLTRIPSLPNSIETQYFLMKKPDPNPNLDPFLVGNSKKDVIIKNEPKSSILSAPSSPTQIPSLSNSKETKSSCIVESDQEDEEDQESEFTLGRLIRQASMNSSHTANPPRQTSKEMIENMRKKVELDEEKIIDVRKIERNRKNSGKKKNGGGGAPAIPRGWVDKSSSEEMKAHIKFWARAVASNVRQECS